MEGQERNIHRDIIVRCQQQDRIAQEKLYKLYAKAMYNVCRRMMGDDEDAKDVLQDAFVLAFQKLPELREICTFSAWIKRIVVNQCINAIRKKKLLTVSMEDERFDVKMEEVNDDTLEQYQVSQIMKAIEKLPTGSRTVLSLYLFEGYDHKEIGEILGVTESASKAQFCKAKAKIRDLLADKTRLYAG